MLTKNPIPRWECLVLVIAFLVLIGNPGLRQLTTDAEKIDLMEKRSLVKPPGWEELKTEPEKFPEKFEAFFNDHFGWRRELVNAGSRLKLQWLAVSPSSLAVCGRQDWIFYTGDESLSDYRGLRKLSTAEMEGWRRWLEAREEWLAIRGIRYLFVIPPNKQTIYPEFMPSSYARRRGPGILDQLLDYLKKTGCTVRVVDLRPALLGAKASGQVYMKADSHWSEFGGFVGAQEVIEALRVWFPEMKPEAAEGRFSTILRYYGEDLPTMLGAPGIVSENLTFYRPPDGEQFKEEFFTLPRSPEETLLAPVNVTPSHPQTNRRAVVLRDSFGVALLKPLSRHFARSTHIWYTKYHDRDFEADIAGFVEREKPDVVIEQMVERLIVSVRKDDLCFGGKSESE